ncbi:MAG: carboxylating nicotinate-nucleotide diphosphorylase [Vicinamibacterales bacterium]
MSPLIPLATSDYRELVRRALDEDVGSGDVTTTSTVPADARARGVFLAKSDLVVAGLDVAIETFRQIDGHAVLAVVRRDGSRCPAGETIAVVEGHARALLTGERTALNFLQRLSGIATLTRRYVEAAAGRIVILDTRKTTPTLRALEKYAVRAGGGTNHRVGLFDAVLIKDNHVRLAGGVAAAVDRMKHAHPAFPVEIEAQCLAEVQQAVEAGADTVLLDNLSLDEIRSALQAIDGRARTEISGGVTLDQIPEIAATGADFVSIGALTHSAPAADISFEIESL